MIKYTLLLFSLFAIAWGQNFTEPSLFGSDTVHSGAWLYSSNDGFGHNFGVDEDNLRTFGINLGGIVQSRFLLSGDIYSFTDRNSSEEQSLRTDELKFLAGYKFLEKAIRERGNFSLFGGAGFMMYGDFGSSSIQTNAHDMGNPESVRPVTHHYADSGIRGALFGSGTATFPSFETALFTMITHRFDFMGSVSGGYWQRRPYLQLNYYLKGTFNRYTSQGSVVENVYRAENGIWLGTKTVAGPFYLERAFNLFNLNQYSFVGLRFQSGGFAIPSSTENRISYSIGWPIGHNSWIEFFRVHPTQQRPRFALFLRTYHTENVYHNKSTNEPDDRLVRRIKEASMGSELSLLDPSKDPWFNGFIFGGAGFNREMVGTYDMLESRFSIMNTFPMIHFGTGARIFFPNIKEREKWLNVGAEIRINTRISLGDTEVYSNPDMLLSWGLVFAQ